MRRMKIVLIAAVTTVVAVAATFAAAWPAVRGDIQRRTRITKSKDNIGAMLKCLLSAGLFPQPMPQFSGRRYVLWLVAADFLDRSDPAQLAILFSPGDRERSLAQAGGIAAYKDLETYVLRDPAKDVSSLTSYFGRRQPRTRNTGLTALIADLSFGDVALVGFSDGSVKEMTKADLGLRPDDPLVAGEASSSPVLREFGD